MAGRHSPVATAGGPSVDGVYTNQKCPGTSLYTPALLWQKRFYDFNVWSARKQIEKLRYIHRNPVKRGLVERPEQWRWQLPSLLLWRDRYSYA
jgi:hypothetical protein